MESSKGCFFDLIPKHRRFFPRFFQGGKKGYVLNIILRNRIKQRWSPRGRPWPRGRPREHILKSLALASRPQVLENWPVLGSRTALFFELLKFCGAVEKFFGKRFFVEIA